jgi:hypothetical protein
MEWKRCARLVLALLLFGFFGAFSILGDVVSHTLGLRLVGVPVTISNLMAGSPRTGHLALGYLLGVVCLLASSSLVGRIVVLRGK